MSPRGRRTLAVASASFAWAPAVFAATRVWLHLRAPAPDATAVLSTEATPFVGRVTVTLYATAILGALAIARLRRDPERLGRCFEWGVGVSALSTLAAMAWVR